MCESLFRVTVVHTIIYLRSKFSLHRNDRIFHDVTKTKKRYNFDPLQKSLTILVSALYAARFVYSHLLPGTLLFLLLVNCKTKNRICHPINGLKFSKRIHNENSRFYSLTVYISVVFHFNNRLFLLLNAFICIILCMCIYLHIKYWK